jgi:tetratricopeptide (TPR) repeat protein
LKKLFIPGLAFIAVIIIGLIIWQLFPQKEVELAPKIENSIAVISFDNKTGDKNYDYLQEVIPNLLITNIENTGLFYVVTWERMRDILKQMGRENVEIIDQDLGFEVCRREGVQAIAVGSFSKAGNVFVTDVKVLDVETKNLLKSESARGSGEESIFNTQIDELSEAISLSLGATTSEVESSLTQVKEITTDSLEAYRYFLNGKEAFWFLYWDECRQWMEKALEIDPAFTLASLYLAWAYQHLEDYKSRDATLEKAKAFIDRASEKNRLYFEADYAIFVKQDPDKHYQILRKLIDKYPKERRALHYLGDYLNQYKSQYADAIIEYKKALDLDPKDASMINHIIWAYMASEDYDMAKKYFELYDTIAPRDPWNLELRGWMHIDLGKIDQAISIYKELFLIKPDYVRAYGSYSYVHALKEEYAVSLVLLEEYVSKAPSLGSKAIAHYLKSSVLFWVGQFEKAQNDLSIAGKLAEEVENRDMQCAVEWMKGIVAITKGNSERSISHFKKYSEMVQLYFPNEALSFKWSGDGMLEYLTIKQGDTKKAKSWLKEMETIIESIPESQKPILNFMYKSLQGKIYLVEGAFEDTILILEELLQNRISFSWYTQNYWALRFLFTREALAQAYEKQGEVDKAISVYEKLILSPVKERPEMIYPKYHYYLARLYEKSGRISDAVSHYEKFLDLWKDADPGIAEVEDARMRVAGLKSK